jgi:hypothetical protein
MKLEDIDKNLPLTVPEGYFDELPMRIQSRMIRQDEIDHRIFTISWSWRRTAMVGMAASIVGVLLWLTYPTRQLSLSEDTLSHVSDESIVKYLDQKNVLSQRDLVESSIPLTINNSTMIDSTLIQDLEISNEDILDELEKEDIKEVI